MTPTEYLVSYGRSAYVGRFANQSGSAFAHGDRVVVRSGRGVETGAVLDAAAPSFAHLVGTAPAGELLRPYSPDDEQGESGLAARAEALVADAQSRADELGLPLTVLDVEITLDGERAVLQTLPWADCDSDPLCEELSARHHLSLTLLDLRRQPAAPDADTGGCGKPGCGSGDGGCTSCGTGGGCSTGGCSKGSVKSAEELTSYFAGLRQQMESTFGRVPLHE
jgi:hypothetical protein